MVETMSFEEVLSERVTAKIQEPVDDRADKVDLYRRYQPILRGFEEFNMRRFLTRDYIHFFELVLYDFARCLKCNGSCTSSIYQSPKNEDDLQRQPHMYFSLSYGGMKFYNGAHPVFVAKECPGVAKRKEQIRKMLIKEEDR